MWIVVIKACQFSRGVNGFAGAEHLRWPAVCAIIIAVRIYQLNLFCMNKEKNTNKNDTPGNNNDLEGNDKAPGEEQGKAEKVTLNDLKGKKNDGDPSLGKDQPLKQ
jgi:hypothetical protein